MLSITTSRTWQITSLSYKLLPSVFIITLNVNTDSSFLVLLIQHLHKKQNFFSIQMLHNICDIYKLPLLSNQDVLYIISHNIIHKNVYSLYIRNPINEYLTNYGQKKVHK